MAGLVASTASPLRAGVVRDGSHTDRPQDCAVSTFDTYAETVLLWGMAVVIGLVGVAAGLERVL
jgi:hypothetical protein